MCYANEMAWTRKLPAKITLKDGRVLTTLAEARQMVLAVPEPQQSHPHWQYAVELLLKAAEHEGDVEKVWAQLRRALLVEGMI